MFLNYSINFWLERKVLCKVQQNKIPPKRFKSSVLLRVLYLLFKQWLVIFYTLKQDVRKLQGEVILSDVVIIKGM
jgi:hypothetical protein